MKGGGEAPLPRDAEQIDPQTWRRLLGSDAKDRAAAAAQVRDQGERERYAGALVGAVEDDAGYSLGHRRAAGEALGLLGDPRIVTRDPALVRVPAGPFLLGTRAEDMPKIIKEYKHARVQRRFVAKEMPQHEVQVAEFEIGKYPVTNQEYAEFAQATGRAAPPSWDGPTFPEGRGNHPVTRISHDDAVAYTEWLSAETGRRYRQPTEVEWEKAARGTDGRLYPWGNDFEPERCNTLEGNTFATLYKRARPVFNVVLRIGSVVVDSGLLGDRFDKAMATTPVGIYPNGASPYGALDMAGNAEEWVADTFWLYPGYPFADEFDWSAEDWVCRGGAWNRPGDVARTARRHGNFVGTGSIGLRLARDVES
ncbi:MAG: formylglycine-generating enzyme family protein [Gaiellaceae bacterium]